MSSLGRDRHRPFQHEPPKRIARRPDQSFFQAHLLQDVVGHAVVDPVGFVPVVHDRIKADRVEIDDFACVAAVA